MFFIHALADPLVMSLLGLVIAVLLLLVGWRKLGTTALTATGLFLYLAATPLVSERLLSALEPDGLLTRSQGGAAPEAIVVLSANFRYFAPEFGGETAGDLTLERMRFGALLQRAKDLPILVTGGHLGKSRDSIARVMAEAFATDYGIAVRWIEDRAGDTFENANFSKRILETAGIETIYLVTHAWHMRRAQAAFEHVGFRVVPAPTGFTKVRPGVAPYDFVPRAKCLKATAYAFHEWIGYLWYEWRRF